MTQYDWSSDEARNSASYLEGLAMDLVLLAVLVVALVWTWSAGVAPSVVLLIGFAATLDAAKTVNRVLTHHRSFSQH